MRVHARYDRNGASQSLTDRPTASELLSAIADLLEKQVLGVTQGALRHSVRVAGNLSRILAREADVGLALERREVELLAEVLGEAPADRGARALSRARAERLAPEPLLALARELAPGTPP